MIPHLFYYQLVVLGLLWLCVMLHAVWPSRGAESQPRPAEAAPLKSKRKRSREPKPFAGLTHKPHCALCEQQTAENAPAPPPRPDPMPLTHRRPRTVDTSMHFCPHLNCDYCGWLGLNNLRANGHPSGGQWRQFHCTSCDGYFPEHHGTIFHGKQAAVELIVHVLACLAEGLGIRATARVFEVDPNTVLGWLVEAAEQLKAFAHYFLCEVHVHQVQLDELYAVLSAVKDGELSEDEAIKRLSRSPQWVWVAIDPVSKLLLAIDVGQRTLAMAQRVVHQVVQVLAPGCVPLFLTDGFKEYTTALLTHYGQWGQPERRQAQGPNPKPRWMPLPQLLYAQVVKTVRRRRLVRVHHRVVCGTLEAIQQVLAACGWQINTAFIERVNLSIRQHVAAVGRRVSTLCKGEEGLQQQLVLYQVYYNFCLPHASLHLPLLQPEPTKGNGSAKRWQPRTPAMAAGLTDHVWTLREVLLFRVPPWPQPAGM
jgi:IS1 family transposase/transposase-like protein